MPLLPTGTVQQVTGVFDWQQQSGGGQDVLFQDVPLVWWYVSGSTLSAEWPRVRFAGG
jgi:hypothetical protein